MITIIIPTYKRPKTVAKAIKSALCQTVKEIQVFVYDDASGDNTRSVVEDLRHFDKRLHYFTHEKNQGMTANYEFSRSLVSTKYFSFLSDDDILLPTFCETALKAFETHPEIAFSATSTLVVSPQYHWLDDPIADWSREGYFTPIEGLLEVAKKYPVLNTALFRTECVRSIPIDHTNKILWDYDFFLKIAAQYPIAITKQPSALFFRHDTSFSSTIDYADWLEGIAKITGNIHKCTTIPETLKTQVISLLMNRDHIHYAFQKMFRSFMEADVESTERYKKIILLKKNTFTINMRIYWLIFKCRKIFPALIFLLDSVWKTKAHREQERKLTKKIADHHSYWDTYFEQDYQKILP